MYNTYVYGNQPVKEVIYYYAPILTIFGSFRCRFRSNCIVLLSYCYVRVRIHRCSLSVCYVVRHCHCVVSLYVSLPLLSYVARVVTLLSCTWTRCYRYSIRIRLRLRLRLRCYRIVTCSVRIVSYCTLYYTYSTYSYTFTYVFVFVITYIAGRVLSMWWHMLLCIVILITCSYMYCYMFDNMLYVLTYV